ncbi:MAG TPA: hypothetical protein VFU21_07950 [Kofleriaceae bacterium]|nr:hypothetical protein [Kofleriaceae bacterium]
MKRTLYTTVAAGFCALALAASGCEKKKDEAGGGGAAGGGGKGPAGAQAAVPSKTGFAVFPGDSQFVVGINLASARSSGLWAKYKDKVEAQMASEFAELRDACGIDPIGQVQTIIAAGKQGGGGEPDAVVVMKGLQRGALKTCGEKMAAKEGKKLTVTEEGNLANYVVDDKNIWAAWLDDSTVVIAPEKDKAYVSARAAGEGGLAEGSPVMALLKSVDTSAAIYFAADTAMMGPQAAMMQGAKGIFGSLKLTDGLAIDAGLRFDTPDNAKKMTEMVNQQVGAMKGQLPPQFKSVVDKAVIKQVDKDMVVQLSLSGAELEQLAQALEGMKGMLGGGMGGL